MQISVAILVTVNTAKTYVERIIKSFIARVNSLGGIFEAKLCLITALTELNSIGLLEKASLVITPNAYNTGVIYDVVPNTSLGDLTVERATTGSRVNSAQLIQTEGINIPRLDYSNGTCPSWLIEPQETNIFNYSEEFDNPFWIKGAVGGVANPAVTPNVSISPDGTLNADQVDFPSIGAGQTSIIFVPFTSTGVNYSQSYYIKGLYGTEVIWITYTPDGVNFITKICNLTTDWQRFDLSALIPIGGSNITIGVDTRDPLQTIRPAQTIFLWGGQLELNAYATSYIKTIATTVTRNFDKISKVGISSLLNPSEGVFYIEAAALNQTDSDSRSFNVNDVIGDNYVAIQYQLDGDVRFDVRSGVNINRLNISAVIDTDFNKIAISWGPSGIYGYLNGVQYVIPQFQGTIPSIPVTLTRISFFRGSSANIANSYLKESAVFKTQLTDAECILLTTKAPSTVVIGAQTWTTENLQVEHYRNGDAIPQVTDQATWDALTTGAWCYYDNLTANGVVYGKLYNWYAVNDPRGLAPEGFRIPSSDEFNTLRTYLGGESVAGGKMKSTGNALVGDGLWRSPNTGATNESGFTALPAGRRIIGSFTNKTEITDFWSSTGLSLFGAKSFTIDYSSPSLFSLTLGESKVKGFSVRLIKNT